MALQTGRSPQPVPGPRRPANPRQQEPVEFMLPILFCCQKRLKNYSSVNSEKHGDQSSRVNSKSSRTARTLCLQLAWGKLTKDQWVLSTIKGYRIEFHHMPYQAHKPHTPKFNRDQQVLIEQEVQKLMDKGAVAQLKMVPQDSFVSTLFLVPRKMRSKTGHQPQVPELVCGVSTLQNGRYSDIQEPRETGRLASESGSKGCLLLSPDSSGPQEIPVLHSRRENISVHMPPVRPDLSTLGLYQDPQAHSSSGTRVGVSSSNLYRRHTADGGIERDGTGTRHSLDIFTPVPGFHHKPRKNG